MERVASIESRREARRCDSIGNAMNPAVRAYLDKAPAGQRRHLEELRALIAAALPRAEETLGSNGFPVYTIDDRWVAGFATRKKCAMLYIMTTGVLDRHAEALGRLRTGNSCIEFRETGDLSLDALRALVGKMLSEAAKAM